MVTRRGIRGALVGLGCAAMAWAGTAGSASAALSTGQYSGRAYALGIMGVKIAGVATADTTAGDTGQLPAAGGTVTSPGGKVTIPNVVSATVVTEQATGIGGTSAATSSVTAADVLPVAGVSLLRATVLTADTGVTCAGQKTLASSVATVVINAPPPLGKIIVPVNPAPNSTFTVPGLTPGSVVATIIFNQQIYTAASNTALANALVVTFPANGVLAAVIQGTITISHAESDLTGCSPFAVAKTANGSPTATVAPGSDVTYAITLTNQVNTACTLTSVSDLLPPQPGEGGIPFTYVSGGPSGAPTGVVTTAAGGQNVVTWTFTPPAPSIAVGGTFTFSFIAHVPANEPAGKYTNVGQYVSNCGSGSGINGTSTSTSSSLTTVTVTGAPGPTPTPTPTPAPAPAPVPATGGGLPSPGLPLGLELFGAALATAAIADRIRTRRKS